MDLQSVPFNVAYVFDDIDDTCWAWEKLYTDVLDRHAPLRSIKCRTETGKSKFTTADIRKAIRKRNALKRKFNKTRKSQDWESYRVMRNRVVAMRRKSIVQHFDKLLNTRSSKPQEFWNSVRPLIHSRKQDGNSYITLKENNKIIKEQHTR